MCGALRTFPAGLVRTLMRAFRQRARVRVLNFHLTVHCPAMHTSELLCPFLHAKRATRTRIHPGSCNVVRIGIPVLSPVRSAQPPPHHPCHPPDNVNTTHACEQFYDNSIQHQRAHASARARACVYVVGKFRNKTITFRAENHKIDRKS